MNNYYPALLSLSVVILSGGAVSASPLNDVPAGHWAKPAVRNLVQKKILSVEPDGKFQGSKPVTRYELAVALDRMVNYIEAGRKPLHVGPPQSAILVPAGAGHAVKAAVAHLSGEGFLPRTSPLFQGKGTESVTAGQLSEALAQVTISLSDRSVPPNKE